MSILKFPSEAEEYDLPLLRVTMELQRIKALAVEYDEQIRLDTIACCMATIKLASIILRPEIKRLVPKEDLGFTREINKLSMAILEKNDPHLMEMI